MSYLVLVRHGESVWNAQGLWTGWRDIDLDVKGRAVAGGVGEKLRGINFQIAYTSKLLRAIHTLDEIKKVLGAENLETVEDSALNERDYGDYTGKNKWELQKLFGEEKFQRIRRGWDEPVPNGETLKDVYNRVVPFYQSHILEDLKNGKNVLVVAHGNSLRALVKYIEDIPDVEIPNIEIATGEIDIYEMDAEGKILSKEIKKPD